MESVLSLQSRIGTTVNILLEGFRIPVMVSDIKVQWGRVRLLVTPMSGTGTQWIDDARVIK